MDRRNKIIYILTIVSIIAFALMQIYWLYTRYIFTLEAQSSDLYSQIINIYDIDLKNRAENPDTSLYVMTSLHASKPYKNDSLKNQEWKCDVVLYKSKYRIPIDSVQDMLLRKDFRLTSEQQLSFRISEPPSENEMYEAIRAVSINLRNPINLDTLSNKLEQKGIDIMSIKLAYTKVIKWSGEYQRDGYFFDPYVVIQIPVDVLQCSFLSIKIKIPLSPVIKDLSWTLIFTLVISITLIVCLIIQVVTIRKQNMIAELRQNFIATMLHELKRPLFTLKMCISSLGFSKLDNEKIKMELLNQSRNEIDNLSSYFSKLRELSSNETSGIPVNITKVNLSKILNECTSKLHIPTEKDVTFTLFCDEI